MEKLETRGRKKGEPTFVQSLRVRKIHKDFFSNLENVTKFVLEKIGETPEYKKFAKEWEQDEKEKLQPNLFKEAL